MATKVTFLNEVCDLVIERSGNNTRLRLVNDNGPMATCTASSTGIPVPAGCVAIKDYSENEGMLDALMSAGVVSAPVGFIEQEFVRLHICRLLVQE